jgi:hypothetical protein
MSYILSRVYVCATVLRLFQSVLEDINRFNQARRKAKCTTFLILFTFDLVMFPVCFTGGNKV